MTSVTTISITSHFDDVFRRATKLINSSAIESELIVFLESVERCRTKLLDQRSENDVMRRRVKQLEEELKSANLQITNMRVMIDKEIQKRQEVEKSKQSLAQLLNCIRDVLSSNPEVFDEETKEKLASLGSPLRLGARRQSSGSPARLSVIDECTLSDASFDNTSDTLGSSFDQMLDVSITNRRARRKRRPPTTPLTVKKKRNSSGPIDCPENFATPLANSTALQILPDPTGDKPDDYPKHKENVDDVINMPARGEPCRPVTRQLSLAVQEDLGTTGPFQMYASQASLASEVAKLARTPSSTEKLRHFSSTGKVNNRPHTFVSKVITGLESCQPCGRRFKFYSTAQRCQDCKAVSHTECREKVPLPCVPTVATPSSKSGQHTISDYVTSTPPMIPPLIIYCCREIESRGMNDVGLYRLSGSVQQVKELKEKILKGKGTPDLSKVDIHVLCSLVKKFLSDLQEPLITRSLWKTFVSATDISNSHDGESGMYQAISLLPQPNRDTLAYLILHLQRVAESPECLMPIDNIAKIFGPTIVGYSVPDPTATMACEETTQQAAVVRSLLQISSDYWSTLIKTEDENIFPPIGISPDIRQRIMQRCNAGKVYPSPKPSPSPAILGRTPITSKQKKTSGKRPPFFRTPVWK